MSTPKILSISTSAINVGFVPIMIASSKPGFQIHAIQTALSENQMVRAAALPTPNLSDAMGKILPACDQLKPMHRVNRSMVGRALTVRVPPGDNMLVYKAIASAGPNDVIVVDAGGALAQAIVGEIMTTLAQSRGAAGVVIYGSIRDIDIIGNSEFPVYACGYTYRGPYRDGPGQLNIPIAIGGMPVSPGDLIVGDANGVLVVPYESVDNVLTAAEQIKERETKIVEQIEQGSYDIAWIDSMLRDRGYEI
jgi:RraA family protein